MGGTASVYEPDPHPAQRNRRSLYAEKIRGLRDPFLRDLQPARTRQVVRTARDFDRRAAGPHPLQFAEEIQERALAFAARLLRGAHRTGIRRRRTAPSTLALGRLATPRTNSPPASHHWKRRHGGGRKARSYQPKEFPDPDTGFPHRDGREDRRALQLLRSIHARLHRLPVPTPSAQRRRRPHPRTGPPLPRALFNLNEFAYLD